MSVTYRSATIDDVPTILGFIRALADYERLAHECIATEEILRESLFGEKPGAEVIFAEVGGKAVGFALFFHSFSTFKGRRGLYLEDLFVDPEFRGLGIGKGLLTRLAQTAIDRGCARFEWSVLDWNEPSIEFYKAMGAKPMDEWTVFRVDGRALINLATR